MPSSSVAIVKENTAKTVPLIRITINVTITSPIPIHLNVILTTNNAPTKHIPAIISGNEKLKLNAVYITAVIVNITRIITFNDLYIIS